MSYYFKVNNVSANLVFSGKKFGTYSNTPLDYPNYDIFRDLLTYLGSIGFYITNDKTVSKSIRDSYFYGRYNGLEFKAQISPLGFEFVFFQNINYKNPHGGYYDFNKYDKMPYLIKLEFIKTTNKMSDFLINRGIIKKVIEDDNNYKYAVDKVKFKYVNSYHKPQQDMNFNLSDIDGTTESESYNICDRDKKIIYNGDVKYFRDQDGALKRGKVYHNINNMWWVIINKYTVRNITSLDLFDANDEDLKQRRLVPNNIPKEYIEKRKIINQMTIKELKRALRRKLNERRI